jgi:hypothetical protein
MSVYIQIQRRGTCSFRHQINIQVLLCLTKNISEHTIVILAHLTRRVMSVIVIILHLFVCRRYVVHRLQSSPLALAGMVIGKMIFKFVKMKLILPFEIFAL